MQDFNGLNPNQKQAVMTPSQYVRIVAGAGSGKTKVLTSRIVYLVETIGIFAGQILAITFTNKAANEMKERIYQLLKDDGRGVFVSTIHSFCVRVLREDIGVLGWPRNFTVLDQNDQKSLVKQAYKELNMQAQEFPFGSMLNYIAGNKAANITADHALTLAGSHPFEKKKAKVYGYYLERCEKNYWLDFDDLLLKTVHLFKQSANTRQKWQNRFQYIHVDEFQDVDHVQYELLLMLKSDTNSVYVVGDPDQTIYTWRGADVNIILNFEKDFAPCETIVLNENYRSTPSILKGANSLIKNNQYRVDKELFTNQVDQQKIMHVQLESDEVESQWIASKLLELNRNNISYKQCAILYRSNYLSRSMEKSLRDRGIPYIIYGGVRFYDRMEVKDVLSYLRLITISDDLAFIRVINQPKRGIGDKTIQIIQETANELNVSLYEAAKKTSTLSRGASQKVSDFLDMIEYFKGKYESIPIDELIQEVLEKTGMRQLLVKDKETDRLENIKELINDANDFMIRYPEADIIEYLQMVSLYGDKAELMQSDYVQLMTVHAAKGLEFDVVFLMAMSEGIFPNERSMSEGKLGLEEERRLAYVAMTRAKKQLYLSESMGFSYVMGRPKTPSRFIKEIDEDVIEHHIASQYKNVKVKGLYTPKEDFSSPTNVKFAKGELLTHTTFGDGVVIDIQGQLVVVAFDYPHGVKSILASHSSLQKKERTYS
jgi:DNA helicase II / ATP-dependent DNA helicase PcrA